MIDYSLLTEKQSVSVTPTPGLAGPGPAPSLGVLVRNAG